MINLSIPEAASDIIPVIQEIIRRSIDGSVVPLFVDLANQRVLIGAIAASTSNIGKLEVTGDIKIVGNGKGLIVNNRNGSNTYRILVDNDGALVADQIT